MAKTAAWESAERRAANARRRMVGESFDDLCDRYRGQLERAALSLTGNPHDAADLVQETLLRAYRAYHRFEPGSSFRAWVLRILHNTHVSNYRRRRHYGALVEWNEITENNEIRSGDLPGQGGDPEQMYLAALPDEDVQRALDDLPDGFRQVVELADLYECSYDEIGQRLELPIGTVRSRLFRARQRLREALGGYAVRHNLVGPLVGA